MVRYQIVDDRDGTLLAEHASPGQALRSFGRFARNPHVRARVSVVRFEHELGGMARVTSMMSVRSLCHAERRARSRWPSVT